ncbi:polar growth protein, partial [Tulasnella sp. UAMH 9824]
MVEYVWALHDFSPEHEDEISFRAGDRIEIVEKDDQYGDGWWQGRTPDGQVGLFPQAYTTTNPPGQQLSGVPELRMPPTLDSLPEESEEGTSPTRDNAVMAATMTDVQHALDQLAVSRGAGADDTSRRTFSFIESGTETDHDTTGDEDEEAQSPDGHRGNSRRLLAENVVKQNEHDAAVKALNDRLAPPIPVEMSDESEPEDDEITSPLHSPPETARAANFADHGDLRTPIPQAFAKDADRAEPRSSPPKHVAELPPIAAPSPPSPPRSPLRAPIILQAAPTEDAPASATGSQFITATTSSTSSLKSPITPSPPGAFSNEPKLYSEPDPSTMPKSPTVADTPQQVIPPEAKAAPALQVVEASTPALVPPPQEAEAATTTPSMASIATVVPSQAPPSPKPIQLGSPISFPIIHSPTPSMPTATIITQQQQR